MVWWVDDDMVWKMDDDMVWKMDDDMWMMVWHGGGWYGMEDE